jgi:hypothetical protein
MSLKTWLQFALGKGRRHIVMMLALALTANVWSMSPAAGHGLFSTDALDLASDATAIVGVSETSDTAKGEIDDLDDGSYTVAYPDLPKPIDATLGTIETRAGEAKDWDGFPHKTGPPTHA